MAESQMSVGGSPSGSPMSGLSDETLIMGEWPPCWHDAVQGVKFFIDRVVSFMTSLEALRLAEINKASQIQVKD